jgi:uncharacterized SAM-binding protein YcdF (DUF218 family)
VSDDVVARPRRRWRRWLAWGLVGAVMASLLFGPWVLRSLPGWLTERDDPRPADALVVLAGDHFGSRVDAACALWAAGHVPKGPFVISGGAIYGEVTWAQLMRDRAVARGVPLERILLQDRSRTTAQDARYTAELLDERGVGVVLLVTGEWHSGRAAAVFRRELEGVEVVSCASPEPYPQAWWTDAEATRGVVLEVLKRLWPGDGS